MQYTSRRWQKFKEKKICTNIKAVGCTVWLGWVTKYFDYIVIIFIISWMHFIIILVLLTVAIASPALTRTAQVCSNVLNVKQIAMTNQNQIIALCSSNVDSNEPILVYDLLTNTSHPITKNSKELVSIFYFEPNNMNILFGTRNSTIYQYDMPTGKISWDLKSPQPNVIV